MTYCVNQVQFSALVRSTKKLCENHSVHLPLESNMVFPGQSENQEFKNSVKPSKNILSGWHLLVSANRILFPHQADRILARVMFAYFILNIGNYAFKFI